jgi:hypothetical protein
VQPRIRLGRSFDQRSHTYLGYALRVRGNIGSEVREFLVGVGEGAHAKHQFQVGDTVSGEALPVADPGLELNLLDKQFWSGTISMGGQTVPSSKPLSSA